VVDGQYKLQPGAKVTSSGAGAGGVPVLGGTSETQKGVGGATSM
jgi:hypothetical protein